MIVRKIVLRDFRNIELADLSFDGRAQFFLGPNGQGKTNLLEAIGFVTALRSFRTSDPRLLIRQGTAEASAAYEFERESEGGVRVTVQLRPGGKEVTVAGERVRRMGDFIGRYPMVVFSSDDAQIVRGGAGARRRLIDVTLAASDPVYYEALRDYHKALASRNRLLKNDSAAAAAAFEGPMAESGAVLAVRRRHVAESFAGLAGELYRDLTGGAEEAIFSYCPDVAVERPEELRATWEEGRRRDLIAGLTRRGPHRDDFEIGFSGKPAREFGSEGQQRGLALALRMAQLRYLQDALQVRPVLLADDIVNELDPERRRRFWESLDAEIQVLAAGTALPEASSRGSWQVFGVSDGRFFEQSY